MAEINVTSVDMTANKSKHLTKVSLDSTLNKMAQMITDVMKIDPMEFEIYHGLKKLDKSSTEQLSSKGIDKDSTLYVVKNKNLLEADPVAELPEVDQAQSCLSRLSAMMKGTQRKNITKTLQDENIMKPIIAATPNIQNDQMALDFLKNPSLFSVVIDPSNTQMLVKKHPAFLMVCLSVWHIIATEALQRVTLEESDEEMNTSDPQNVAEPIQVGPSQTSTASSASNPPRQIITASQLAAAVQATIGAFGGSSSSSTVPPRGTNQTSTQPRSQSRPKPKISEEVMQAGLKQLREMGLTDEMVCRRVLEATKGNVQAAITILFS